MAGQTTFSRKVFRVALCFLLMLSTGCSLKVQRKALHKSDDTRALQGLDGKSPWLKAHLPDGDLYLLTDWRVDEDRRNITGQGSRFNARRDVVASGPFTVSLDSVAIFESNTLHTSPAIASLTVMSVLSAGMTAFCIANPKSCFGSCPTFYARNETGEPMLMAEGFSASVSPTLEAADLDALFRTAPAGGEFTLTMTNEALETHVVRQAELYVAPRPVDGKILAAQDGTWWQADNLLSAASCRGPEGDCTELLSACDGKERFSLADSQYLGTKETLELEFPHLPAGNLGLVVGSRHSLLSTFLFYQGLAYLGQHAAPALVRFDPNQESPTGSKSLGDLLGKIEVQVPGPDGTWATAGVTGETGPLAVNVHTLRLPELNPADRRLRLKLTRGNWRLDYVALAVLDKQVFPERLSPTNVLRDGVPDPQALEDLISPDRTLITLPGDRFDLVYHLPTDGPRWDVFLLSQGYYLEWMRTEWLAEEDPIKAALMFRYPELALSYLAPRFKELEPDMEAQFWGSRYAR